MPTAGEPDADHDKMDIDPITKPIAEPLMKRPQAFSLIELLLVVVILSTLASIVFPPMFSSADDVEVAAAQQIVRIVRQQLDISYEQNGTWPANIQREWFIGRVLPKNPFVLEHPRTIQSDVDGSSSADKWHPRDKTTQQHPFWYNKHNGAFAIRVPKQRSDEQTLDLYNRANQAQAKSRHDTSR